MKIIKVLEQDTIDQIAAGEVVERPASIVKELVENAVDAGAGAITVEVKDGGISQIRVTDNGEGIDESQVRAAFLRHATSKLEKLSDLDTIMTHGFRGEALSSIGAVSMVEMITKRAGSLTGTRYRMEGGREIGLEQIGAPEGTTILVRNLFYNVPARKKFLKSAVTEAGYINQLMERIALSHPGISFKLISGSKTRLYTSGNHQIRDVIYGIYGRETAAALLAVDETSGDIRVSGFVGKPSLSRGNRNQENYFVNERFVRSQLLSKAIEEAYRPYMMQHRFPFTCLQITVDGKQVDVNVHPAKLEVRFQDQQAVYETVMKAVADALGGKELIPKVSADESSEEAARAREEEKERRSLTAMLDVPEPFEALRRNLMAENKSPYQPRYPQRTASVTHRESAGAPALRPAPATYQAPDERREEVRRPAAEKYTVEKSVQQELFESDFLKQEAAPKIKIIGQLFDTYWLAEYEDSLYIIDQHAAHEKVMYERIVARFRDRQITTQAISPPIVLTLSALEESTLKEYGELFESTGFEIEPFGGSEYQLRGAPDALLGVPDRELFIEMIDSLASGSAAPSKQVLLDKMATMACKSAVKGGNRLSRPEAQALLDEMMTLENPYNCPHGRPTVIRMTRTELEKKFKRIV